MTNAATPGLGDPYWFEWTVGLDYIVQLLNPDSSVAAVRLQSPKGKGLDDVVVTYKGGQVRHIQVKHTRDGARLSFADLVTPVGDNLLRSMAQAWKDLSPKDPESEAWLFTNRRLVNKATHSRPRGRARRRHLRPPLRAFLRHLARQLDSARTLQDIAVPRLWQTAWEDDWCPALAPLSTDSDKLAFLRALRVVRGCSLTRLAQRVRDSLGRSLGIPPAAAADLLPHLDHALRRWATSAGDSRLVTAEDVHEALALVNDPLIGEHDLPPPEPFLDSRRPFVDDLARTLLARESPIQFLTSSPGGGKTSVVSFLANRHDPVIDARYHAFRPITPDSPVIDSDSGRTATAEALWNDLLTQFRGMFRGRLAKHSVPLRNDFLDVRHQREHVLRLAREFAELRGRTTVIAIDGIDHAARAGTPPTEAFLASLVPPEEVPTGVAFLIAGQPTSAYPQYPIWLRQTHPGVRIWEVPPPSESDIGGLLSQADVFADPTDRASASRLIHREAAGNLLSAVFAVQEARQCNDLGILEERLREKQLSSGIQEYYESIWGNVASRVDAQVPLASGRLAACISLAAGRVSGTTLAGCFSDLPLKNGDWNEALRLLSPLLIEEPNGFRVFHNDVRVHLTKSCQSAPQRLSEVAGRMAEYYLATPELVHERHASVFNLLRIAGKQASRPSIFTPQWILEAAAHDCPSGELFEQARDAAQDLLDGTTSDWDLAQGLSCSLFTLRQLEASRSLTAEDGGRSDSLSSPPPILPSEGRVLARSKWSVEALQASLRDAERLLVVGEVSRARGLLSRWFAGLAPRDLRTILESSEVPGVRPRRDDSGSDLKEVMRLWGDLSVRFEVPRGGRRARRKDDPNRHDELNFNGGAILRVSTTPGVLQWARALRQSGGLYLTDLENALGNLHRAGRWRELGFALRHLSPKENWSPRFRAWAAGVTLIGGLTRSRSTWVDPIVQNPSQMYRDSVEFQGAMPDSRLAACAWLTFVLAWTEEARPPYEIFQEALGLTESARHRDSDRPVWAQALWPAAILGRALRYRLSGERGRCESYLASLGPGSLSSAIRGLLGMEDFGFSTYKSDLHTLAPALLAGFEFLASGEGNRAQDDVREEYLAFARSHRVTAEIDRVWPYLASLGYHELLSEWADAWIGKMGQVWGLTFDERFTIGREFAARARRAGMNALADDAESRLRWGCIGYGGRKDYSVHNPLEWFRVVAGRTPSAWRDIGLRLLAVSRGASVVGDNRADTDVDAAVGTAAACAGVAEFWSLYCARGTSSPEPWMPPGSSMQVDGLIGMLEVGSFAPGELEAIWACIIGLLPWQSGADSVRLADAHNALLAAARRCRVRLALPPLAPAEAAAVANRERYRAVTRLVEIEAQDGEGEGVVEPSVGARPLSRAVHEACVALRDGESSGRGARWKQVADCLKRIESTRPANCADLVRQLHDAILQNMRDYPWYYDGCTVAIQALVPLLNDQTRWGLCRSIGRHLSASHGGVSVDAIAEDLNAICLARARASDARVAIAGCERLVSMHELWLDAAGHLPPINKVVLPDVTQETPESWPEFAVRALLDLLPYDDAPELEATIRGLALLLRVAPECASSLEAAAGALARRSAYHVLLAAEGEAGDPSQHGRWLPFVKSCAGRPELEVKLQAWIVLAAHARAAGRRAPAWSPTRWPESGLAIEGAMPRGGLLDVPSIDIGKLQFVPGGRAVRVVVQHFRTIVDSRASDLESRIASSLTERPVVEAKPHRRPGRHEGLVITRDGQSERLLDIIANDLRKGRWRGLPPTVLAQAILHGDEPRLIVRTPERLGDEAGWPMDSALETLLTASRGNELEATLLRPLRQGVPDDCLVLAGLLETYSDRSDVELVVNHVWFRDPTVLGVPRGVRTLSGRGLTLFEGRRFEAGMVDGGAWLAQRVGGLFEFHTQSCGLVPSTVLQRMFRWGPTPPDPFSWKYRGKKVAWFQRLAGPFRDDRHEYRQPMLYRWVCRRDALDHAIKRVGGRLKAHSAVERAVFKAR